MGHKRAKRGSCSVFGCTNKHKCVFLVPSAKPLKNQWVNFSLSGNAPTQLPVCLYVCAIHFTDDCFVNLGKYRAGHAELLKNKSRSIPTLLGSATNLGQVTEQTPDTISIKVEEDIGGVMPAVADCDSFGDHSMQCSAPDTISIKVEEDIGGVMPAVDHSMQHGATTESLCVDPHGSPHMSSHKGELRILSVYGKGEGPLAVDGHDTLFTTFKVEDLNPLSVDHSVAKSLDHGQRLVCCEEQSVQQNPDTISIKVEEDIGGGMPAVADCDSFGDHSMQCSAPDSISIKVEEDIGGGMPTVADCDASGDHSMQRGATTESLRVDPPGSPHMSSHNGELRILSVYGKGEGPLAVDGHDTLFTTFKVEELNSLSADADQGQRLVCCEEQSVQQTPDTISIKVEEDIGGYMPAVEDCDDIHREELTGPQGGCKSRPCVLCGKVFPNNAKMIVHMRTHTDEKPYGCDQCMKRFSQKGNLKIHLRTHSGEKPFSCDQCAKRFQQQYKLKRHIWTHTGEKPYSCAQCTKGFTRSCKLKCHMMIHSGKKPYSCDQCSKSFIESTSLKIHMRSHTGEKPYRCDQCMKRFSESSSLKTHMRTHTGEKPYSCDQCTKSFSESSSLKIHIRTHTGEKPERCDQCMKRFRQKSALSSHMKTHTGEKPYSCDQCTKRFRQSSALKVHLRTHTGEKPYRCDQCTKSFRRLCKLKIHMMTHSGEMPYSCDQCTKSFRQSCKLKSHMMTHSGEMPYSCDQCTKRFRQSSALKIHMMTHSGELPYSCDQCTKGFRQSYALKVHMRTHLKALCPKRAPPV